MIPKKLHFVWLGRPIFGVYKLLYERWLAMYPDWEVTLWDDDACLELIRNMGTDLADRFTQADLTLSTRSDLARYHIIASEGGVYVDTDFLVLRRIDHLLRHPLFLVSEHQQARRICSGVFGAPPGHPLFPTVFETLRNQNYDLGPVQLAGPEMFGPVCEQFLLTNPGMVLECQSFFPVLYGQQSSLEQWLSRDASSSYAAHLWAGSWLNEPVPESKLAERVGGMLLNPTTR